MEHDFLQGNVSKTRYSNSGTLCTGVGGYMDYRENPNKWSKCSAEDFYRYFASVAQSRPVCLGKILCPNIFYFHYEILYRLKVIDLLSFSFF